jgi:secreted trypsin-like serine protease
MYMFEDGEELIKIDKITMHDGFSSTARGLANDIALVFLEEPSKFAPIKLNRDPELPVSGSMLRLLGWGRIDEVIGRPQWTLREVDLPVVDNQTCARANDGLEIHDHNICAGYMDGQTEKGSCKGDSGGPLFSAEGDKSLVGIVSGGRGCARLNTPSFYTRVSSFIKWIEDRTGPLPR